MYACKMLLQTMIKPLFNRFGTMYTFESITWRSEDTFAGELNIVFEPLMWEDAENMRLKEDGLNVYPNIMDVAAGL